MKFVMNQSTFATLSLTAAALISSGATASNFAGNVVVASPVRTAFHIRQNIPIYEFLSCPIKVLMRSGVYEYPQFNLVTSAYPYAVETTGSCYRIVATVTSSNQTRFQIFHDGTPNVGVQSIEFGGATQQLIFDRAAPNPGTSFSETGRDVQYRGGAGAWTAVAEWHNPIKVGPVAQLGDVYSGLKIRFNAASAASYFDAGSHFYFDVDTDIAW